MFCLLFHCLCYFRILGLYSTYSSVILADTALALPFAIIILRTSFLQIPDALEEAGWIDGGSRLQVLWYIILPLVRAGLVAAGVLSFLTAWGEFVFALSFLPKPEMQPVSLGIFQFIGMYKSNFDTMMAFSTLVAIPAVVALMFLQREFVSGLTTGYVNEANPLNDEVMPDHIISEFFDCSIIIY